MRNDWIILTLGLTVFLSGETVSISTALETWGEKCNSGSTYGPAAPAFRPVWRTPLVFGSLPSLGFLCKELILKKKLLTAWFAKRSHCPLKLRFDSLSPLFAGFTRRKSLERFSLRQDKILKPTWFKFVVVVTLEMDLYAACRVLFLQHLYERDWLYGHRFRGMWLRTGLDHHTGC